jgi:hypothetical protein
MANREQKRSSRQKRKARGAERRAAGAERRAAMAERTEEKNRRVRESLDPLEPNERPTVVTISAIVALVIAVGNPLAYLLLPSLGVDRPPLINVVWPTILMGMAAYGLWRARYWAVLGFDVLLVFLMLACVNLLIIASNAVVAVVAVLLIVGAGALFFFMVKAMARIQMPERRAPGAGR